MNIIVCIKQVPDPEVSSEYYVINNNTNRVEPKGIPPVLSAFDENALETALRIKDTRDDVTVRVISMGMKISNAVLQKALAVGADELIKVEGDEFESGKLDSHGTAAALASAIIKSGTFDLILVGRQAVDWNAGHTGIFLAEILGLPVITLAKKIEVNGNIVFIERLTPDGYEVVESPLPAVVMVTNELGLMRYPTIIQRREAKNKPVKEWNADIINFKGSFENRVILKKLYKPELRKGNCVIIEGSSPDNAGEKLAQRLNMDGII